MVESTKWITAKIYDLSFKHIGSTRLPDEPHRPRLIMWGNRYFTLRSHLGVYVETTCYFVPIENMYVHAAAGSEHGSGKLKP